ncbi:hypothetical protein IPH25_00820 [bacterium]|nr:MAG: hypothetical protein IPG37_02940 [bacterium]QQR61970.1 MAG: hypothetical protein IPH25_00820 [bacterium]QQR62437.1 MAG: hypothetical protein IPH67_03340 [bacterium]
MKRLIVAMTVLFFARHAHADNPTEVTQAITQTAAEQVTKEAQKEVMPEEKPKIYDHPLVTLEFRERDELSVKQALSIIGGYFFLHTFQLTLNSYLKNKIGTDRCYLLQAMRVAHYGVYFHPMYLAYQSLIQKLERKLKTYPIANKIMSAKMWNHFPFIKQLLTVGGAVATLIAGTNVGKSIGYKISQL